MAHQGGAVGLDRRPITGSEGPVHSAPGAMFRCPRCQREYPQRLLVSRWSEWGQICWCRESGELNLACVALAIEQSPAGGSPCPG